MKTIDVQAYYKKLAEQTPISEEEIQQLLQSYESAMALATHLSDCHAATAEGLGASAPTSAKKRMRDICATAAQGLDGGFNRHSARKPEVAQDRCRRSARELDVQIQAHEAEAARRADERKAAKAKKPSP